MNVKSMFQNVDVLAPYKYTVHYTSMSLDYLYSHKGNPPHPKKKKDLVIYSQIVTFSKYISMLLCYNFKKYDYI